MTNLHMPVIEPPTPLPANIVDYYAGVASETTVIALPAAHDAITIQIANPAHAKLYAMTSGFVSFIPVGTPLHPLSVAPATKPTLLLEVDVTDINALRKRTSVPLVKYILYEGVDPASVRASPGLFDLVRKLLLEHLQLAWPHPTSEDNRDVLANSYLDQFLQGIRKVAVLSGTFLGRAETVSPPSGPAVFTLRMASPQKHNVSPVPLLKAMPDIGADGRKRYDQHPLALAVASLPVPINIYLKFEVWDLSAKVYRALPAGVRVALMDKDTTIDDQLDFRLTDANGCVHFYYSTLADLKRPDEDESDNPDIFFLVQFQESQRQYAGHTLPAEWSTKGWKSANGKYSGYYETYDGRVLGRDGDPAVFRIGLDLHLQLEYIDNKGKTIKAPKGIPIALQAHPFPRWRTDEGGQVHAVVFDVPPKTDVEHYFQVLFEIEDSSINLPRAYINIIPWSTNTPDADQRLYPKQDVPSIGTYKKPASLLCTVGERNVALYILKVVRELSVFLYHLTKHEWTGINNLMINTISLKDVSYSGPIGVLNIHQDSHWNRTTLIHELSHEVMWKEGDFGSLFFVYHWMLGNIGSHTTSMLGSAQIALTEGWAEFMGEIFNPELKTSPPFIFNEVKPYISADWEPLHPRAPRAPDGLGERVEGAFANGLWTIFRKYVAPSTAFAYPLVLESENGDISATTIWITQEDVQNNFLKLIWRPLQALKSMSDPTTTLMIAEIKARNQDKWPSIQRDLQEFNLAP